MFKKTICIAVLLLGTQCASINSLNASEFNTALLGQEEEITRKASTQLVHFKKTLAKLPKDRITPLSFSKTHDKILENFTTAMLALANEHNVSNKEFFGVSRSQRHPSITDPISLQRTGIIPFQEQESHIASKLMFEKIHDGLVLTTCAVRAINCESFYDGNDVVRQKAAEERYVADSRTEQEKIESHDYQDYIDSIIYNQQKSRHAYYATQKRTVPQFENYSTDLSARFRKQDQLIIIERFFDTEKTISLGSIATWSIFETWSDEYYNDLKIENFDHSTFLILHPYHHRVVPIMEIAKQSWLKCVETDFSTDPETLYVHLATYTYLFIQAKPYYRGSEVILRWMLKVLCQFHSLSERFVDLIEHKKVYSFSSEAYIAHFREYFR